MIVGRVIQGVAGGVFPLSFGIIRDTFPRERVPGAIGLLSAMFGIGGGIGLPLSGIVVDNFDLSLALLDRPDRPARAALAAHLSSRPRRRGARTRASTGSAPRCSRARSCSVLLGRDRGQRLGLDLARHVALIGGGVVFALAWMRVEARVTEPLSTCACCASGRWRPPTWPGC